MSKGLKFFSSDYCEAALNGIATASSNVAFVAFAFDGISDTKWISDGEDTDGNDVYLEMDFRIDRSIDSFFIYNTNIEDIEVQYHNGSVWVTCSSAIATISKSSDLAHLFVKLATPIITQKVRIVGGDTIIPNEEKYVTLFHAFLELGQFEYFPNFTPKNNVFQSNFQTIDGRNIILERGGCFEADITFKSHVNQNDITLIQTLLNRREPFFVWPCGGDVSIFNFSFYPYRFQDIFKVGILGDNNPSLTKNYYKSGYNNKIKIVEVA